MNFFCMGWISRLDLEWGRTFDAQHFSGDGVTEFDALGMEEKPSIGCAIEPVSQDGSVEAVGVGCMYAQLVGAPGQRVKCDPSLACFDLQDTVFGNGRFPVNGIDRLSRSIVRIRTQGKIDSTAMGVDDALQKGNVVLLDGPMPELGL